MARPRPNPDTAAAPATSRNGGGGDATPEPRYCATCGRDVPAEAAGLQRFGETLCSEAHAEEFARAVRTARVQTAARADSGATCAASAGPGWKGKLGKALCWGGPLLVLGVLLVGGTGAITGAASAALPFLALLACPLGMYLMMRAMTKTGLRR